MRNRLLLSVVVPAFNEEKRIESTIHRLVNYLEGQSYGYEIIVVDDGSTDSTKSKIKNMAERYEMLRMVENQENAGKGYAVKRGVSHATGEFILLTDTDMSTPMEELGKLFFWLKEGYDIAIGSRGLPESRIIVRQTWCRQNMGRLFNLLVHIFFLLPFRDTQCGFKLFKGDVAKTLFNKQRISGFAFDVEILYLAKREKFKIREVPVEWKNYSPSKLHLFKGAISMFWELITIRVNAWKGIYR
ncbi:MAG TPA: glycosyltransferase family 2 protein [Candidatus Omnitrophica bacterium]|nr:glycosyltransferase family 2 protein [Candidatus Omnitrophota bacterium]